MPNIDRFINAQSTYFPIALSEIKSGMKRSHWMWFIFPQIAGLGRTKISRYYSIRDKAEAIEFLNNEVLRYNILEITRTFLSLNEEPQIVLGRIDAIKMKSSMTLFDFIEPNNLFGDVLNKFYDGKRCQYTLLKLENN